MGENNNTYSPLFCWAKMAACKSAEQEKLLGSIFSTSRLTCLAGEGGTLKRWIWSYRLFSIHSLHPQPPVGLRQSLQGDDAMSAGDGQRATVSRREPRGVHLSLCCLPVSPLDHLDVKTEAFVDRVPLSSDTRAQPEHLGGAVHHAVLSTGRVFFKDGLSNRSICLGPPDNCVKYC